MSNVSYVVVDLKYDLFSMGQYWEIPFYRCGSPSRDKVTIKLVEFWKQSNCLDLRATPLYEGELLEFVDALNPSEEELSYYTLLYGDSIMRYYKESLEKYYEENK